MAIQISVREKDTLDVYDIWLTFDEQELTIGIRPLHGLCL